MQQPPYFAGIAGQGHGNACQTPDRIRLWQSSVGASVPSTILRGIETPRFPFEVRDSPAQPGSSHVSLSDLSLRKHQVQQQQQHDLYGYSPYGAQHQSWLDAAPAPAPPLFSAPGFTSFRSASNVRGANEDPERSPLKQNGWGNDRSRMESVASSYCSNWSPSITRYAFVDPLRIEGDITLPHALDHLALQTRRPTPVLSQPQQPSLSSTIHPAQSHFQPVYHSNGSVDQHPAFSWESFLANPVPDYSALPNLALDEDPDSRRASTSTELSTFLPSPQDLPQPVYQASYGCPLPKTARQEQHAAAVPSILGKRSSMVFSGESNVDYEDYFNHIPISSPVYSRPTPLPEVHVTEQPVARILHFDSSPPCMSISSVAYLPLKSFSLVNRTTVPPPNKRQRMYNIDETPVRAMIPPASLPTATTAQKTQVSQLPRSTSGSSQTLAPIPSQPHIYRRLSSPVASVRPAFEGEDALDDEDEEEHKPLAGIVSHPAVSSKRSGVVDSEEHSSQATVTDEDEYLPPKTAIHQAYPTSAHISATAAVPALSTYILQPASQVLLSLPPVSAAPVTHTIISIPTFTGTRSVPAVENSTEAPDPLNKARKQKLRFPEDLYTPIWVRGNGAGKEGFCDMCEPGKWLQLKNSAFWYHKQFSHGVSSVSGNYFAAPLQLRENEDDGSTEGLCHQCNSWIVYTTRRQNLAEAEGVRVPALWYKHAHKCHVYVTKSKAVTSHRPTRKAA